MTTSPLAAVPVSPLKIAAYSAYLAAWVVFAIAAVVGALPRRRLARGSKRHLMKPGPLKEGTTLCGCVVTGGYGWLRISALEGDECEECAALSFQAPSQASNMSSGGAGEEEESGPRISTTRRLSNIRIRSFNSHYLGSV